MKKYSIKAGARLRSSSFLKTKKTPANAGAFYKTDLIKN
ncbi:hypothetical protein PPRY_a2852 [Pseudoalteromonas prydzensis ACAM 620]|nr:hypothetical protein [Pseudoalteromonas prydzensis ACAM 620]